MGIADVRPLGTLRCRLARVGVCASLVAAISSCHVDDDPEHARGAAQFFAVNGTNCHFQRGFHLPPDQPSLTADNSVRGVRDGEFGAVVVCTMSAIDDAVSVDARIAMDDMLFAVSGRVSPIGNDAYAGSGTLRIATPEMGDLRNDADGCTISVSPPQWMCTPETSRDCRDGGYIWATYDCEGLRDESQPPIDCGGQGTFLFAQCASE